MSDEYWEDGENSDMAEDHSLEDLGENDRIMIVEPYSPMNAEIIQKGGSSSKNLRDFFLHEAHAIDPNLGQYYRALYTIAREQGLNAASDEHGNMVLFGNKRGIKAANHLLSAYYHTRIFTKTEYAAFSEKLEENREFDTPEEEADFIAATSIMH